MFLMAVPHSRCNIRNETSDWRAAGLVARAIPTGMLTKPKLMDPFQIVLIVFQCQASAWLGVISAAPRL